MLVACYQVGGLLGRSFRDQIPAVVGSLRGVRSGTSVQGVAQEDGMPGFGDFRPCATSSTKRALRRTWTVTVWWGVCVSPKAKF